mgnify:FL=1
MFVHKSYKFIFIHNPKVAGTSIRNSFNPAGFKVLRNKDGYPHSPASLVKKRVGDEIWDEYFKLAFVRNPYDRCVSFYFYHQSPQYKRIQGHNHSTIEETKKPYKEWLIKQLSAQHNMVAIPQSVYINRPLDFIGRYENLENDYQYFIKKIGGEKQLPHYNKSIDHNSWEHYYDDELKEIVGKHFKDDFDLFGYAI